jgi:hypothetical protein
VCGCVLGVRAGTGCASWRQAARHRAVLTAVPSRARPADHPPRHLCKEHSAGRCSCKGVRHGPGQVLQRRRAADSCAGRGGLCSSGGAWVPSPAVPLCVSQMSVSPRVKRVSCYCPVVSSTLFYG